MRLQDTLAQTAQHFPNKIALKYKGQAYTYSQIDTITTNSANDLKSQGVQSGDRVLIFLGNHPQTIFYLYAALKADAVFVIVHPRTKLNKLQYILNDCTAHTLISSIDYFESPVQVDHLKQSCPALKSTILLENISSKENSDTHSPVVNYQKPIADSLSPKAIDLDLAALIYTSGSTGFPKGVMMSHLNMLTAIRSITDYLNNTEDDIIYNALPLSFDYGLYQVLMTFYFGGTLLLEQDMIYAQSVLKVVQDEKITGLPLVPTMNDLLWQVQNLDDFDLQHLRYITNTGSALNKNQIQLIRKCLPHVQIFAMYGLTECKRVSYLDPPQIDSRPDSVGKAMPNLQTMIVDETGKILGPNQIGELVVRGASVMQGYWNDPIGTAERLRPGLKHGERVLYTGDLFTMNEEGYLYFVGHIDEMLKVKGERIYPLEVEQVIIELPEVIEVAVVGIRDDLWIHKIKAYIIWADLTKRPDKNLILRFCRQQLDRFAIPQEIEFVTNFPRTSSGKIDKKQLH